MVVDWFTVVAQVLNFLALVWLLKRFLYTPILNAIDARELRITTELADAAAKQSDADKQHETFRLKNEEFDAQKDALLSQASAEAAEVRHQLIVEAREAADALRSEREEGLKNEFQTIQNEVTRRSRDEVFAVSRKVLGELAGVKLEDRMTELFIERLGELDTATKKRLKATHETTDQPMKIQSEFDLNTEQRFRIQKALQEAFETDSKLHFETVPGVIAGIELVLDGHRIAWSVSEYLVELEKNIAEILGEEKPGFRSGKTS